MVKNEREITMLLKKADMLGRIPKKQDFSPADVARIKSKLGPWPRALEAAGLKDQKKQIKKQRG